MSKTIQVRVDDQLKYEADNLFASLGLDTSTAIRMFLAASIERDGIPFEVRRQPDPDATILKAIAHRKAGGAFLTAEESVNNMRNIIKAKE